MFGGQIDNGNESGDEQLNDHNLWSQYLNPQPESEPQAQAEHQLQIEPEAVTQLVIPPNNQALSLTQAAAPEQLTVSPSGPVLTQPTLQFDIIDQQLPVATPCSILHATAFCEDDTAVDTEHKMLTGQCAAHMVQGKASMDVKNAQHEASLQAHHGANVVPVDADAIKPAAARSTRGAGPECLPTVEPAQQADTAGAMADGADAQHQDRAETRSEGQLAELDNSGFSPQTELHHELPADSAMADAEHVSQSPSSRHLPSDLQGSHGDGPETGQGSMLSDEAQRAQHATASEVGQVHQAQQAPQRSSDDVAESRHAQQASDVQALEAQRAQQTSDHQSEEAEHGQQAPDVKMDDAQHVPDIPTEEVKQPHAQQEHVVEMQGPQPTPDVDVEAAQHAQQPSDSALQEAQHAQQARDIDMSDAQQAAGPVQQDLQHGPADTAEDLPLQPRRSRRGKGPAQDGTDPQTGSATKVAPQEATGAAAEAPAKSAPNSDQEEAVVAPPATRSSAAKHAAGKTRSAKPAVKPPAKHDGAHKAAGRPETQKTPGPISQPQQQHPAAKRSHKKQPKRQWLAAPEGVAQQKAPKASAGGAGKQVQEAAQQPDVAEDGTGETELVSSHTKSAACLPLCWQPL